MKRLRLEVGTVTREQQPMPDDTSQKFDFSERRKLPAQPAISRINAFRKHEPNPVVPRRFGTVPKHANQVVAQVNRKARKHPPHLGVQGHQCFQNEPVRSLLFRFGRSWHGSQLLSESTITDPKALLTEDTTSTLAAPALTTSALLPQDFHSTENVAPVATGIGTAEQQTIQEDP